MCMRHYLSFIFCFFFFQAEDGIRDYKVTGVQTCALPIYRPIGIFDSGLGGLTVARAVIEVLPRESIVYFGDTARFPYGTKPLEEVKRNADDVIGFLCDQDVKAIVVACNSASSALFRLGRPK